jgi:hypothetical protein
VQRLDSILATNSSNFLRHNLQNNKTHQIHKHIITKIFGIVETSHHQQFSRQSQLGFVAFIQKTNDIVF